MPRCMSFPVGRGRPCLGAEEVSRREEIGIGLALQEVPWFLSSSQPHFTVGTRTWEGVTAQILRSLAGLEARSIGGLAVLLGVWFGE